MSYFIISFKNTLVYRANVLWEIFGSVCSVYITIALWTYVYRENPAMREYMTAYVILAHLIRQFYTNVICDRISESVRTGMFSIDLIRPVNYLWMNLMQVSGMAASSLVLQGLPLLLVFSVPLLRSFAHRGPLTLLAGLAAVLLGHLLHTLLFALVGFLAFLCTEVWPFRRLLSDTIQFFSGSFLPLALFPDFLKEIAYATPFPWLFSFPLRLLLGDIKGAEILRGFGILGLWLLGTAAVLLTVYTKAIDKATVQGG